MNVMDILKQTGGIDAIANQLGIPPAMAELGASALAPAILGGFQKQETVGGAGGLGDLIGMLGGLGGAGLADNVVGPEPTNVGAGNEILGQIFGSKDVSRSVAGHAAGQTGIDPELLKKMLPIVAMLVAGYISHRAGGNEAQTGGAGAGGGILGSVLGSVLGGGGQSGAGGALGSILGSVLGGGGGQAAAPAAGGGALGGLASILDMNHDGNPLDDIIGMAGKLAR